MKTRTNLIRLLAFVILQGTVCQPQAAQPADGLAGYTVLASVESGRTLFIQKPDLHSAKAAVVATLRDLGKVFDDKPIVSGAFGDEKDRQCRGAFTAKLKGQAIKGFVACGVGDKGAAITVVYDRSDAPAAAVAALLAALPVSSKLVEHPLAGGSGTIKFPADWKITRSDAIGGVTVEGPAGQKVALGSGASVVTPDSLVVAQARSLGMPITMFVAPYCDPANALKILLPQASLMSQRNGGPAFTLEKIISVEPCSAYTPNGQAAVVASAFTKTSGREVVHLRESARIECYPLSQTAWAYSANSVSAPAAIFERDLPLMLAIGQSWKLNSQAVQSNSRQMIDAQNRAFNAFQQSMKEKNAAFGRYMQSVQNNERVREKCNADFDEVIRGTRTVEDTRTGERRDVDLGYSTEIVDKLNEKEGYARYHEIPLRDQ